MKGKDPKEELSKRELQDPKKVQNLAPEPAKCEKCGSVLPGEIHEEDQKSGHAASQNVKMRHGQY